MINRNIDSILSQSYYKLADIAYQLAINSTAGLEGTANQKSLWNKAISIDQILETVFNNIEIQNGLFYRTLGATDEEINKFLSVLIELTEIYDYPVVLYLPNYSSIINIGTGNQGQPGADGSSSYSAIAFATDNTGAGFSASPDVSRPYVAFKTSNAPIPMIAASFAGLWVKYIGDAGADGNDGADGEDGNTILYGAVDPTTEGIDGNFYINTTTTVLFGPKAGGVWPTGVPLIGADGADGVDGADGNTILYGIGAPTNGDGNNGDFWIDTAANFIYGPKDNDMWPAGTSIVGPPGSSGTNGTDGTDGTSSTLYIAWADDSIGTGFTLTFDPNKDYIAYFVDEVGLTPVVGDFAGLWAKYQGDGDRWNTTSGTSVTIGTGIKNFVIGINLSYSTGQRIVIAKDDDEDNRMEGYVRSYDPTTGQIAVDVDTTVGSGTYNVWDVNLFGVPVQVITTDSYFGEIYVENNTAGTPQALSSTFEKITQFTANGPVSPGVNVSHTNDNIQATVRGAYRLTANLSVSTGTAATELIIALFKNGTAITGTQSRVLLPLTTDIYEITIDTIQELNGNDTIDVRAKVVSGTPNVLVEEGRLSISTTGSPSSPDFTTFENADVDSAATEDVDTFLASIAYGVVWEVVIRKGTNRRKVRVDATWEGTTVASSQGNVVDLGTIDVTLTVDINGGNVRLRATTTSDDWIVSGNRTLIK